MATASGDSPKASEEEWANVLPNAITTSLAASPVTGAANGQKISLLVENDEALGKPAFLVVVDQSGQTIFKHPVVVGEN
jgi:uncharacterized protein YggU (UPF0235/DUF167 family)